MKNLPTKKIEAYLEVDTSTDSSDYSVSIFMGDTLIGEYDLYDLGTDIKSQISLLIGINNPIERIKDESSIINILKKYSSVIEDNKFYCHEDIPTKKLNNSIKSYCKEWSDDERAIALFDDTLLGSSKDGFLISSKAIYCKNLLEKPWKLNLDEIQSADVDLENDEIVLNDFFRIKITPSDKKKSVAIIAKIINEICSL